MVSRVSSAPTSHAALLVVDGIRTWELFPHTPLTQVRRSRFPRMRPVSFFSARETYLGYNVLVFVNGLAGAWYHENKD